MKIVLSALASFAATNVDDLVLLMILAAQAADNRVKKRHIWAGQFLAIGLITALGVAGGLAIDLLPKGFDSYLRYLGFLPIVLAVLQFVDAKRGAKHKRRQKTRTRLQAAPRQDEDAGGKVGVGQVFFLLFSAGADNVGVYIPLFAGMTRPELYVSVGLFAALAGLFCFLALRLAGHKKLEETIQKYEGIVVPAVLVLIGLSMLLGA